MQYRSVSDMDAALVRNLHRLPRDLDLVVGVPRSGLLAANLLALAANIPLSDMDSYVDGRIYATGTTKRVGTRRTQPGSRKVLVLDDSVNLGHALARAREKVAAAGLGDEVIFAAVYGCKAKHPQADIILETVPQPRIFQWNFMHHAFLERSCVDIDGVLCLDPTDEENDDGPAYKSFLARARPLYVPTRPIHTLVTSRLEKYRPQTEAWLAEFGIRYGKLVMLDLPSAAERRRLGAHGGYKGRVYRDSDAILFIESENGQARTIAQMSGKPVLCLETHALLEPSLGAKLINLPRPGVARRGSRAIGRLARSWLGPKRYAALKRTLQG